MNTDNFITAVLALRNAKRLVVFTGAGVSSESGVPTFRDEDGFWKRFPTEKFGTWNGLFSTAMSHPRLVAEFVLNVVEPIAKAAPNAGHLAIAELQNHISTSVITQNIDGLHQLAGSKTVYEVHGSLLEVVHYGKRDVVHRFDQRDLLEIAAALQGYVEHQASLFSMLRRLRRTFKIDWRGPRCPNLVLFGDQLAEPAWTEARRVVEECDVLLMVGTSGQVYPAAFLPGVAADRGATVITIDPQPALYCWLEGTAANVLPALVKGAFPAR